MKKISIVGWYGKNNVGDEAFKLVFRKFFENHDLEFVTPPQLCSSFDYLVLGGGAVASPFYLNTLPQGKKLAIGIDLAYESEADLIASKEFRSVYVRTKTDCEILKNKVSFPVYAIPDLAFFIQPKQNTVFRYKKHHDKKTVGVLVTDYVNPAIDRPHEIFGQRSWDFKTKLAAELDLLCSQGYEVLLIPCSTGGYGDDRRINLDIAAFMKNTPTNIMETLGPQEMIDLISGCDFTICQRFHAHIFSIICGVPFVSIEFTRKVKILLEENGLNHWVGGLYQNKNTFDFSKVQLIKQSFNDKDRTKLKTIANKNLTSLEQVKKQVLLEMFEECF